MKRPFVRREKGCLSPRHRFEWRDVCVIIPGIWGGADEPIDSDQTTVPQVGPLNLAISTICFGRMSLTDHTCYV